MKVKGNFASLEFYKQGNLLNYKEKFVKPFNVLEAHRALGSTLYPLGEMVLARTHLEQGIALYDPQYHISSALRYGLDAGVVCHGHASRVLWFLGYPDQATQRSREALALAQGLSHPFSLAFALNFSALLHQLRQEEQVAQERSAALEALAAEHGFAQVMAFATILGGWALAMQGQGEEGITQIRQGITAWRATGAELGLSNYLALLAEACGRVGRIEEGLTTLAEGLEVIARTGDCQYEAELYRLKGELLLNAECGMQNAESSSPALTLNTQHFTLNTQAEAEECFQQAIETARQQQAKSLELRATMSLARLWQQQGKKDEAQQMLAEMYGWFTEGFETKDLQEAKRLLETLA